MAANGDRERARVERLLRERAAEHAAEPLGPGSSDRLRERLLAERRLSGSGRGWRVLVTLTAAAALVLLILRLGAGGGAPLDGGRLEVAVALLDDSGRELDASTPRGGADGFYRPERVLVELVAEREGHVHAFVCAPDGAIEPERSGALAPGEAFGWSLELGGYAVPEGRPPGQAARLALILITSAEALPKERVAAHVPDRLDPRRPRGEALEALRDELARRLGGTVTVREVMLAPARD